MSTQKVWQAIENIERSERAGDLAHIVFAKIVKDFSEREMNGSFNLTSFLRKSGAGSDLIRKSGEIASGGEASGSWGSELATNSTLVAFIESLSQTSVLGALMAGGAARLPLNLSFAAASVVPQAAIVAEAVRAPATEMAFSAAKLERKKGMALLAITGALARNAGPGAAAWINREMGKAVARAVDGEVIDSLVDSITPVTAGGTDATGAKHDIAAALSTIDTGGEGRLLFIGNQNLAAYCALYLDEAGEMTLKGGRLYGAQFIASEHIADGSLVIVNPALCAANAEGLEITTAKDATLIMSSTPGSSTARIALFQEDGVGVKAALYFGAVRGRTDAVAVLESIAWSGLASS